MKWSGFCLLAIFAAVFLLDAHTTSAAPAPRTDDLLKTLQDLEQIYSSMSRPRFGKRDRLTGIYRNGEDYTDEQSNDDAHVAAGGSGGGGSGGARRLVSDAEMRTVSGGGSVGGERDDLALRQRQLQRQLQHLYHY